MSNKMILLGLDHVKQEDFVGIGPCQTRRFCWDWTMSNKTILLELDHVKQDDFVARYEQLTVHVGHLNTSDDKSWVSIGVFIVIEPGSQRWKASALRLPQPDSLNMIVVSVSNQTEYYIKTNRFLHWASSFQVCMFVSVCPVFSNVAEMIVNRLSLR